MDIPRKVLEEALALMKQGRGNAALNRVQDYNITTFGQLERWLRDVGLPSWHDEPATRAFDAKEEAEESEKARPAWDIE